VQLKEGRNKQTSSSTVHGFDFGSS
jgi:hypothetical protein